MKITIKHKDTVIIVDDCEHGSDRNATMRYSDQNKCIIETIEVMANQVKKLQESTKA